MSVSQPHPFSSLTRADQKDGCDGSDDLVCERRFTTIKSAQKDAKLTLKLSTQLLIRGAQVITDAATNIRYMELERWLNTAVVTPISAACVAQIRTEHAELRQTIIKKAEYLAAAINHFSNSIWIEPTSHSNQR